jgi:hypothetical protein
MGEVVVNLDRICTQPKPRVVIAKCLHQFYKDETLTYHCRLAQDGGDPTGCEHDCPCKEALLTCPTCETELEYFSGEGGAFEYLFCPQCNDWAFDFVGRSITRLV